MRELKTKRRRDNDISEWIMLHFRKRWKPSWYRRRKIANVRRHKWRIRKKGRKRGRIRRQRCLRINP
jgi:hypothetical protein